MEDVCRHWYHTHDTEGSEEYCKDCFMILDVQPQWTGKLIIGKLESYFEVPGETFSVKDLIENYLGVSPDIADIRMNGESWRVEYLVSFTVGKAWMSAEFGASKGNKYEPTNLFHVVPEVEEELVEEDLAKA